MESVRDFPAILLGQDAVKKLNMLLSPADTLERDVRSLAGSIGFSRDEVLYIFQKQYPFVYMLDQWLKRERDNATLKVLYERMKDLKRLDAAEVVENVITELSDRDPKEIMHVLEVHSRQLRRSTSTVTLCQVQNTSGPLPVKYDHHQQNIARYAPPNVVDINRSLGKTKVENGAPTVFTVYCADNDQHLRNIRKFIKKMRKDGIDASADMFEEMQSNIDRGFYIYSRLLEAEYVLVLCSELFYQSYEHEYNHSDEDAPDRVKEVSFIMKIILDDIFENFGRNGKYIPVLLAKHCTTDHVPFILKTSTSYKIPVGYEDLKRRLFKIEKYKLDPVIKKPDLKPININELFETTKIFSSRKT